MIDNKIKPKNILIYGAGAIGSLMGYLLSDPPSEDGATIENVALLGRSGHMEKIRSEGLQVEASEGMTQVHFRHLFTDLDEFARSDFHPDVVMICVKTYSLPKLCEEIAQSGLDGKLKDALFLLLMNGMGNRELFETLVPGALGRIHEGITSNGVKLAREGKIDLKGKGATVIEKSLPQELEQFMKTRFEERGFQIEFSADFKRQQWNKLFINSVINPIAALSRQQNKVILSPVLQSAVRRVVGEGVAVARAEGLSFDPDTVLELVLTVAEKTGENSCSMLQDILKNKTTEIDSINGYIVRLAEEHSIAVPVNEALYSLIKATARGS
ncbi:MULTISPECIES: ketopantoate reductase family protein [unclassified Methanothrix]|uniref:ketopantoate reductase family protein n=1 Tax=unclassified Methanothrix TaxID=2620051 RepID=UPI0025810B4B|nr:2-dehydropantoate 2-reductase [Methanosaeta sp. UBA356]